MTSPPSFTLQRGFFILTLLFLTTFSARSQILIGRNYFPAPLDDSTKSTRAFFDALSFGAEGSRGYFSADDEQAWNMKYIGMVTLFRWNQKNAIVTTLAHEFTANPHNDINFHMRGAIWNESLSYFRKNNDYTLEIGVTHHCRHEIDNSIPVDESIPDEDYEPTRRLIVLTSPYIAGSSHLLTISNNLDIRFYGRVHYYTYRVDSRRPRGNNEQDWEEMRLAGILGYRLNAKLKGSVSIYSRSMINPAFFTEDEPLKANFRSEAGFNLQGVKGNFELFASFESYFDDVTRPFPHPSQVLSFGIRGRSKAFF